MRRLVICEKPSLAKAIADTLAGGEGKARRSDGCFEIGDVTVTWLKGHIMALLEPGDYKPEWMPQNNSYDILPMFPERFRKKIKDAYAKGKPTKDYKNIFDTVKRLSCKADILVNAGDPDAEGQILVDEVIEAIGWKGPVERIFVNAYDETTVKKAWENAEDNRSGKNVNVSRAAECRAITDWLIGMNGSRKFTLDAGEGVIVGRVKVPVLALVKRRNEAIENFVSTKYYEPAIEALVDASGESFTAKLKIRDDCKGLDSEGRLIDIDIAEAIISKVNGKNAIVKSIIQKHKTENPELPFSLATLQEYACRKLGISLRQLDDTMQGLYESRKLLTYPRSDCSYIPESQFSDAVAIIEDLKEIGDARLRKLADSADATIKGRAFNTSKTSAHHAIIPTSIKASLEGLSELERKIYLIVAERYLLQFYPQYEYDSTIVELEVEGETFTATGRVVTELGWKAYAEKNDEDKSSEEETCLPKLEKGDACRVTAARILEKNTQPPKYFTQESLVAALTNAYKYVKDKNLVEVIKSIKGIGTPATRSVIIDSLMDNGSLIEKTVSGKGKKRYLFISDKASKLIDCLPETLTFPDQTALMELELEKVASGKLDCEAYLEQVKAYIRGLMRVKTAFDFGIMCPVCKKGKLKRAKSGNYWFCSRWNDADSKCDAGFQDVEGKPFTELCPACGKGYLRKSKTSKWFCTAFKDGCDAHFVDKKGRPELAREIICPLCNKGYLRKNSFGSWSCSEWKSGCKAVFENVSGKPYTERCKVCGKEILRKSKAGSWYCTEFKHCKSRYKDVKGKPCLDT